MASIVKRERSPFWTACFTSRDGRQLKKSTKTASRSQALQIALKFEEVEKQARSGVLTTTQVRKVLNDVSESVTGDSLTAPSVEDYMKDWLQGVEARNSPATLERYKNSVRMFLVGLGGKAKRPLSAVTPKDIEDFLTARLNGGVAPKTAVIDVKTLNVAFRRAEAFGTILKNPVAAIRLPKADCSEREVFTPEEVEKLIEAAPSLDWQTLILFGYFVGARLGDCVHMRWENINTDIGAVVYVQKKTGKKVVVPMHYHVLEHLNHLSPFGTEGFLCPKLAAKGSGGKHGLSEGFKRIVVKAGIDPMTVAGKGSRNFTKRTFHSLRHSFNSALANAGVAEELRMKLTGHSSKAMNGQYTHLQVAALQKAVTALPHFGAKADGAEKTAPPVAAGSSGEASGL